MAERDALRGIELEKNNSEIQRIQLELERMTARYVELYDSAPVGYCTVSENGLILEANLRAAALLGQNRDDLIMQPLCRFINQIDRSHCEALVNLVFQTSKPQTFDLRIDDAHGHPNWIHFSISITQYNQDLKDETSDDPPVCRVVLSDMTDQKQSETDLRVALVKYKALFDCFPLGIVVSDDTGRIVESNQTARRLLGLKGDEHVPLGIDSPDWKLIRVDGSEMPTEEYASVIALKEARTVENVEMGIVQPDQTITWLNVSATPLPLTGYGVVITFSDVTERRMVEQMAKREQSFNEAIIESIPGTFYMLDKYGCYVKWNDYQRNEIVGKSEELIAETNAIDTIYPDDRILIGSKIANVLQNDVIETVEGRVLLRGGPAFRWLLMTGRKVTIEGNPFLVGIGIDITERKQAEEELRQRERVLQKIYDILPIGLWFADKNGRLLRGNPAGVAIWGAEPKVAIDEYGVFKARRLPSGDVIEAEDWALVHTLREGATIVDEMLEIDAFDGKKKIILNSTAPLHNDQGIVDGAIIVNQDITERRRAEEALRLNERLLGSIVETAKDSIFVKDSNLRYIKANSAMGALFEMSVEDLLGKTDADLFGAQAATHIDLIDRMVLAGETIEELPIKPVKGVMRYFHTIKVPLKDSQGKIIGLCGIARDITQQKRDEEESEKLKTLLMHSQKIESVGRLASGVAHDFNNMLSIILGQADMALDKLDPDHDLTDCLQEIRSAAQRSSNLTQKLLAFARKQTVAPKVLDLNDTVEGMLKMLDRLIGENIQLTWVPGSMIWPIRIDPSQIDQILANLCVNARDAISTTGKVMIETESVVVLAEECREHPDSIPGDYTMLSVSDTGCGMDEKTIAHIFEPYFTTKELGKGTGLGLATVYGIVKQNHGFITITSKPDVGTVFKLFFPRHWAEPELTDQEEPQSIDSQCHETILLVEDEPAILKLTMMMLERQGYTVISALSALEAIQLARETPGEIQLLITDVIMPEMNGRELKQHVEGVFPNIKTVFMSGYTADVIAHHGVLEDDVFFIQKPFSIKALVLKVREALGS